METSYSNREFIFVEIAICEKGGLCPPHNGVMCYCAHTRNEVSWTI